MDRLEALETFLVVVETGSFASAANQLDVDRAIVTRRIAYLEKLLGRRLLQRSTRKISITAEGEELLQEATQLRNQAQAFFACDTRKKISGVIRVRCSHSLAAFSAAEVLEQFVDTYSGVSIELQPSEKLTPIVETGADLVLSVSQSPEQGAVAYRLSQCHSIYVASPKYLRGRPLPKSSDEWRGYRLLPLEHEKQWSLLDGVITLTENNAPIRYGNAWLAYQAALRGVGVARLPAIAMRKDIEAGHLLALLPEMPSSLYLWAVLPTNRWVKPAVRALLTMLQKHYGG